MKPFTLAVCVLSSLSFIACDGPPTKPGVLPVHADANASPDKIAGRTNGIAPKGASFPSELGHVSVDNTTDNDAFFTFIVWDYADGVNQIDVSHSDPIFINRHESGTLYAAAFEVDLCKTYQPDVYKGLPKADHYTMSDVNNYLFASPGKLTGPSQHCRTGEPPVDPPIVPPVPPTPPVPPVDPPQCSVSGTFNFPLDNRQLAQFPVGYPSFYPSELGPFAISLPAGVALRLSSVTYDNHSSKTDEYPVGMDPQTHESGFYRFYGASGLLAESIPTMDIPLTADSQDSNLGVYTFSEPVTSIRFFHAGPIPSEEIGPNDSFSVVSLTFGCADGSSVSLLRRR